MNAYLLAEMRLQLDQADHPDRTVHMRGTPAAPRYVFQNSAGETTLAMEHVPSLKFWLTSTPVADNLIGYRQTNRQTKRTTSESHKPASKEELK